MHCNYNLEKAQIYVNRMKEVVKKDLYRQKYHITPEVSWMNDPNGFVFYKGEYHLFYQFHPFSPRWGPMYWGHVKSPDLVHWDHLEIALAPGEIYDRDGCFSGSAVVIDSDELVLFYTGNVFTGPDKNRDLVQKQCMAISKDGLVFSKWEHNPLIGNAPANASQEHFRDPYVWKHGSNWYMVIGSRNRNNLGQALLYRSENLTNWDCIGTVGNNDGTLGYMWECPCMVKTGEKHILIFSPQGVEESEKGLKNWHQAGYLIGEFDYDTVNFVHGGFTELDQGFDYYAPQAIIDQQGRIVVIAWMGMWESEIPTQDHGWAGTMTIPRILEVREDGLIKCLPLPELKMLRSNRREWHEITLNHIDDLNGLSGKTMEIKMTLGIQDMKSQKCGMMLRVSLDRKEKTLIYYDRETREVVFDRNSLGCGPKGIRKTRVSANCRELDLQIFMDASSVEVFINRGEAVMSGRIYPGKDSNGVFLFSDAIEEVKSLIVWDL